MDTMSRPIAKLNRRRTLARKGPAGEIAVAAGRDPGLMPAACRPPAVADRLTLAHPTRNQGGLDD